MLSCDSNGSMVKQRKSIMFLDCQGLKSAGFDGLDALVEISWLVLTGGSEEGCSFEADRFETIVRPVGLLSRQDLRRIMDLCGISPGQLTRAPGEMEVSARFHEVVMNYRPDCIAIHYAAFERPYLERLWQWHAPGEAIPIPIVCTRNLAKDLIPALGAYSIKAVAGFFGFPVTQEKRARSHVDATRAIWDGIASLSRSSKSAMRDVRPGIELREQRLGLPDQPGVYRFFDSSGGVLYVGKATSLRDRVNSYFRGGIRNDLRKREMMAQVKKLEVRALPTPLHAAIEEFRAISSMSPPYNVMMNRENGPLYHLDRDCLAPVFVTGEQQVDRLAGTLGPYQSADVFLELRLLAGLSDKNADVSVMSRLFRGEVDAAILNKGILLAWSVLGLGLESSMIPRAWLRAGVVASLGEVPFSSFGQLEDPLESTVDGHSNEQDGQLVRQWDEHRVKRSILRKVKRAALRFWHALAVRRLAGAQIIYHDTSSLVDQIGGDINLPPKLASLYDFQEIAVALSELRGDRKWVTSTFSDPGARRVILSCGRILRAGCPSMSARMIIADGDFNPL
jgi:DNA polymerase III epsilon subunit-like protein